MEKFKLYTLLEIADILDVSVRSLYSYINNGKLKAVKIGGAWRVTEKNLMEFIEHGTGRRF